MTFTGNCFWDNQVFIAWSLVPAGEIFLHAPRVAGSRVAYRQAGSQAAIGALVEASVAQRTFSLRSGMEGDGCLIQFGARGSVDGHLALPAGQLLPSGRPSRSDARTCGVC